VLLSDFWPVRTRTATAKTAALANGPAKKLTCIRSRLGQFLFLFEWPNCRTEQYVEKRCKHVVAHTDMRELPKKQSLLEGRQRLLKFLVHRGDIGVDDRIEVEE